MLSEAERRKNEIAAILDRDQFLTDLLWLTALLKVSDDAPDADKEVIWLTCVEIAALRGWKWNHGEGRWVRATGDAAAPDSPQHEKEAKTPGLPT